MSVPNTMKSSSNVLHECKLQRRNGKSTIFPSCIDRKDTLCRRTHDIDRYEIPKDRKKIREYRIFKHVKSHSPLCILNTRRLLRWKHVLGTAQQNVGSNITGKAKWKSMPAVLKLFGSSGTTGNWLGRWRLGVETKHLFAQNILMLEQLLVYWKALGINLQDVWRSKKMFGGRPTEVAAGLLDFLQGLQTPR